MKDYLLSELFALIALDGQDSKNDTKAKKAAVLGIAVANALQRMIAEEVDKNVTVFSEQLNKEIKSIRKINKKERNIIESEMAGMLEARGVLTEIPNLLGCDINYQTANVTIKEYKSDSAEYQCITEFVRAEVLEPGEVDLELVCLLYLFRECGCMYDIFSVKEQQQIQVRLIELKEKEPLFKAILDTEFHSRRLEFYLSFLRMKSNLFKKPYLQGINLVFPFLDRKQAVFIDMVVLGTSVQGRRKATVEYLIEQGHSCEEVQIGEEHLLKIDNKYYRIWTGSRRYYRIPVQGISLVPVYM